MARIGNITALVAGVPLFASSATLAAGGVAEMNTPVTEQVPSWVYRTREVAFPLVYSAMAPFAIGATLRYLSQTSLGRNE